MSNLELRPIEIQVLRNASSNDSRQVPAAGATVSVAREGATVTQATTCTVSADATVPVGNIGRLAVGDLVSQNATANLLQVRAVPNDGHGVTLRNVNASGSAIGLVVGDRLMWLSPSNCAVVSQSITCPASTLTEVLVRAPQVSSTLSVHGDGLRTFQVQSVASDGLSVSLISTNDLDVVLAAGAALLDSSGLHVVTVASDTYCPSGSTTTVPTRVCVLAGGVIVYPHGDLSKPLVVAGFDDETRLLTLNNNGSSSITLNAGDRLLVRAGVDVYAEASPSSPLSGNVATVDSRGGSRFYASETRVDCLVQGGGLTAALLLTDRTAGWMRSGTAVLNARDYPSIQDAIDALPPQGGTVLIPSGAYDMIDTLYTPIDRPCELLGEGGDLEGSNGTVLRWTRSTGMLRIRGDGASVRRLTLHMQASGTAEHEHEGYGVFIGRRNVPDAHPRLGVTANEYHQFPWPISRMTLEDVNILTPAGWGVTIPGCLQQSDGELEYALVRPDVGDGGGTLAYWITLKRVRVVGARKYGALFTGGACTTIVLEGCALLHQGDGQTVEPTCYAHVRKSSAVTFRDCTFEGTSPAPASGDLTGTSSPWVRVVGSDSVTFDACYFENDPHYNGEGSGVSYQPQYFVHVAACPADSGTSNPPQRGRGIRVNEAHCVRAGQNAGLLRCLYCDDAAVDGLMIAQLDAISATRLEQVVGQGVLRDSSALRIGVNANIALIAAGQAQDLETGAVLPLTFADLPRAALAHGPFGVVLPIATASERGHFHSTTGEAIFTDDGTVGIERLDGTGGKGALVFYSRESPAGWRLANNLPTLSTSQRDARGGQWRQGDMLLNLSTGYLQVYHAMSWFNLAHLQAE